MRVVAPDEISAPDIVRPIRSLNIELLGLVAVSIAVLFGIALTYSAKVARLEEAAGSGGSGGGSAWKWPAWNSSAWYWPAA